jgi:sucrose-phosphate synthase
VQQILGMDEGSIQQAWLKVSHSANLRLATDRDARMQYLSWRVWGMKRRKAALAQANADALAELRAAREREEADEEAAASAGASGAGGVAPSAANPRPSASGAEGLDGLYKLKPQQYLRVRLGGGGGGGGGCAAPSPLLHHASESSEDAALGTPPSSSAAAATTIAPPFARPPSGTSLLPQNPRPTPFAAAGAPATAGPTTTTTAAAAATTAAAAPASSSLLTGDRVPKLYCALISMHGLVRGDRMELGRDPDTGGQVKYVVELARALARHPAVHRVDLLTRLVADPSVSEDYSRPEELLSEARVGELGGAYIVRLPAGDPNVYLRKEKLWPHVREFADRAVAHISRTLASLVAAGEPCEMYAVHGHYADAGEAAALVAHTLGVDMVLTGHSLGRNKLEHLLKAGSMGRGEAEATYAISRRIEAEERALDAALLVFTSTQQEVNDQWGLYDGYNADLLRVVRARARRGRHFALMRVIPPGLDFSSLKHAPKPPEDPWEALKRAALMAAAGAAQHQGGEDNNKSTTAGNGQNAIAAADGGANSDAYIASLAPPPILSYGQLKSARSSHAGAATGGDNNDATLASSSSGPFACSSAAAPVLSAFGAANAPGTPSAAAATTPTAPLVPLGGMASGPPPEDPPIWGEIFRFLRNPRKPVILAMSRPDAKKNIATLVRAYGQLQPLRDVANLVLVMGNRDAIDNMASGSQKVLDEVLRLVDRYDLYGCVAYPKRHAQSDISDIYLLPAATRGVFVNVALQEPFGLTLIEAGAHGVPIVATRNGGPVDIVHTLRNGLLVDPTDPRAVGQALLKLLTSPAMWDECSQQGISNIHAYSWPSHCARYLAAVEAEKALRAQRVRRVAKSTLSASLDDLLRAGGGVGGAVAGAGGGEGEGVGVGGEESGEQQQDSAALLNGEPQLAALLPPPTTAPPAAGSRRTSSAALGQLLPARPSYAGGGGAGGGDLGIGDDDALAAADDGNGSGEGLALVPPPAAGAAATGLEAAAARLSLDSAAARPSFSGGAAGIGGPELARISAHEGGGAGAAAAVAAGVAIVPVVPASPSRGAVAAAAAAGAALSASANSPNPNAALVPAVLDIPAPPRGCLPHVKDKYIVFSIDSVDSMARLSALLARKGRALLGLAAAAGQTVGVGVASMYGLQETADLLAPAGLTLDDLDFAICQAGSEIWYCRGAVAGGAAGAGGGATASGGGSNRASAPCSPSPLLLSEPVLDEQFEAHIGGHQWDEVSVRRVMAQAIVERNFMPPAPATALASHAQNALAVAAKAAAKAAKGGGTEDNGEDDDTAAAEAATRVLPPAAALGRLSFTRPSITVGADAGAHHLLVTLRRSVVVDRAALATALARTEDGIAAAAIAPGDHGLAAHEQLAVVGRIRRRFRRSGLRTQVCAQLDGAATRLHVTPLRASRSLALRFLAYKHRVDLTSIVVICCAAAVIESPLSLAEADAASAAAASAASAAAKRAAAAAAQAEAAAAGGGGGEGGAAGSSSSPSPAPAAKKPRRLEARFAASDVEDLVAGVQGVLVVPPSSGVVVVPGSAAGGGNSSDAATRGLADGFAVDLGAWDDGRVQLLAPAASSVPASSASQA